MDDELYETAMGEYDKGKGKPFPFCECAKGLQKMPCFDSLMYPRAIVLADMTVLLKNEASNLTAPMCAVLDQPVGVEAAKKWLKEEQEKHGFIHEVDELLQKMTDSYDKMLSVIV